MKASQDKLLQEIADKFTQFLQAGNISSFSQKIDAEINIENIEKLLRIHFILTEEDDEHDIGVVNFIKNLPQSIQSLKTTTSKKATLFKGQIKGKIDWMKTVQARNNRNPNDSSIFICNQREKNYDIPENLVLKKLLQIIHGIVFEDIKFAIDNDYQWLQNWVDDKLLKDVLNRIFLKNVYLRRIDLTENRVTRRMVSDTLKSRNKLYRDAAKLLRKYQKLMDYDFERQEARELLNNTFIQPDKMDVLFELYWCIKIINQFDDPQFQLIEPGENIVANWKYNGRQYTLYHDSVGNFEFSEKLDELYEKVSEQSNFISREIKVVKELRELADMGSNSLWGGRPDIVLEEQDENGKYVSVLIGEIKYTDRESYAIQGLRELLEYIALVKKNEEYWIKGKNLFSDLEKIKGILFTDKIQDFGLNNDEDDSLYLLKFGDGTEHLKKIVK